MIGALQASDISPQPCIPITPKQSVEIALLVYAPPHRKLDVSAESPEIEKQVHTFGEEGSRARLLECGWDLATYMSFKHASSEDREEGVVQRG